MDTLQKSQKKIILNESFLKFSETSNFLKTYMDLALIGDSIFSLKIRISMFNKLRFDNNQDKSNFDGFARSNILMQSYCNHNSFFLDCTGKRIADYFEAYFGWCHLNNLDEEIDLIFNDYFNFVLKNSPQGTFIYSCPLLVKLQPMFFR